jgi:hypothetical protein
MKLPLSNVTGMLRSWYRAPDIDAAQKIDWSALDVTNEPVTSATGWAVLTLRSRNPLFKEEREQRDGYEYFYLYRESGRHLLLVSSRQELVEILVKKLTRYGALAGPSVDVGKLVADVVHEPGRYSVAGLFAKVSGYRSSLESVSLYGSDLASAGLFVELLPKLKPYRVQLRDTHSGQNVLAVGSKGEVSFTYRSALSLRAVDKTLAFLNAGYVSWPETRT